MSLQHAAHHLASQGRGPDDTLVHMSHREVRSLQDIARANGGSLTINPETGLVEAGFLTNLLPMIAGAALTATGVGAPLAALMVGGFQTARTGSLEKGLMAGLGAYGGAGLGSALSASAATTGAPIAGEAASKLASADMALGGQGGSAAAGQYLPSARSAMSGLDTLKYGAQGLGTEAGRSAALGSLGGGFGAAKTAGMALAPVLTDTGDQKAPPPDNEQYNFEYDPGRVEDPDADYKGGFTGERTHFKPSYTRLPNTRVTGMRDGGPAYSDDSGVSFYDDDENVKRYAGETGSVVKDDKDKAVGIQGAAAAKNYVPFEYPASAAQPAGSVQPVAANPFYTMTGQSADAYRYLMGLGPQTKGPTVVKPPVITDAPVTTEKPVVTTRPVVTLGPVITTPFETFTEEETTGELTTFEDDTTEEETTEEEETTGELTTFEDDTTEEEETTTEEEYTTSELTTFEDDTTEEETTTEEEYTTEETTLSIYREPTVTIGDPNITIEDFTFPDLTVEEVTVDKTGYVDILPGDAVVPELVGPRKGGGGDLDEDFDQYLATDTDSLFGGCPAPWINILMADGGFVKAGDIKPGMQVYTRHETTNEWGVYPVTAMEMGEDNRWEVVLEDGRIFVGTFNHRVRTDDNWTEIRNLKIGDKLVQPEGFGIVKSNKELDHGPVVKITVADAHTYISEGFLSHNVKIMDGYDFGDFGGVGGGGGGKYYDDFSSQAMATGGMTSPMIRGLSDLGGYSDGGRLLRGPGDGVSDSIPATIGGKQPARLADGEFVIPARIVSELGNGSTEAGARKLYAMMERIQAGRRKTIGKNRVAANSRADRHLPV